MILQIVTLFWIGAGIIIAWSMPPAAALKATPAAFFHVPMAIAMEIAFIIAAVNGVLWLWKRDPKFDRTSVAFAECGFAFGLIAMTTGAVWAKINWNAYWSWDPQQIGIVATLLTYAGLFSLRGATEDHDKRRNAWAVFAILGIIAAVFWTFAFRQLMPSLHPNRTIIGSNNLYKFALYFNMIGMALLLVCVASIRARILGLQERAIAWKELQWA